MHIMGFGSNEEKEITTPSVPPLQGAEPVRSLVSVRFEDFNGTLSYYNDRFALKEGDRVFVSGKLEGKIGTVETVTTRFRIRLSAYQRVIALGQTPLSGAYVPVMDKMLSTGTDALAPEQFRAWILPPRQEESTEEELVVGDGWEIPLDDPARAEGADHATLNRALDCCRTGKVAYIAVRGEVGKAFVEGTNWYEIDFHLHSGVLTDGYCSCPCFGLCKHQLAVAITLATLRRRGEIDLDHDFTLIDSGFFYRMVQHNRQTIRL